MSPVSKHSGLLDIVFIQDTTASQDPYIQSVKDSIIEICRLIEGSGKVEPNGGLRAGLLAYRDYPPEATEYIVKPFGFTTDVNEMQNNLASLTADEGGDIAEAVDAALHKALNMDWRDEAMKIVVLATDAPPHAIGEQYDNFPSGHSNGYDILDLARKMAEKKIMVYILACEPVLTMYTQYAVDFYSALATITSGAVYPLSDTGILAACIVSSALEGLELRTLSRAYQKEIAERFFVKKEPLEAIVATVHRKLRARQQKVTAIKVASIYTDSPEAKNNREIYIKAESLADARSQLQRVPGARLLPDYEEYSKSFFENRRNGRTFEKSNVKIVFKNTGKEWITVEIYSIESKALEQFPLRPSFVHEMEIPIHSTRNFILASSRFRKNYSRTFASSQEVDVALIWDQTANA